MPTVPMMLSPSYAPKWTAFEALREIVANAMDADPAYTIEFPEANRAVISTATLPRLAHLLMMGSGTKSDSGGTIGQFGEGAKLAALVLTRTPDCRLSIEAGTTSISFSIDEIRGLDEPSLHAHIASIPGDPVKGCVITVEAPDLFTIYDSRFLPRARSTIYGPVSSALESASFRVFHRGILLSTMPEHALYDWNIKDIELNRDRSMPDPYALRRRIGDLIAITPDTVLDAMLDDHACYEWTALNSCWQTDTFKARLLSRFVARFGDKCCIRSSNEAANRAATIRGYRLLTLPDNMRGTLESAGLPTADSLASVADLLDPIDTPSSLINLNHVLDLLDCPCTIRTFNAESHPSSLGKFEAPSTIWLSSRLFQPGARALLLSTLFHEAAHYHSSGASDLSEQFEEALSELGGRLLLPLLRNKD